MSETMVERVKAALYRNGLDACGDATLTAAARAAIAAMREPTQDMEFDGAHVLPDYDPGCEDAKACWQAMIDAALKE